jgi:1,4-dihydroxy-2-naphthoate octaprenyltransferase
VLVGAYLIVTAGWQLLLVGIASILAGVLYTGGPRPYGYEGLGEVFVFLFFGVVAVTGTYFCQREHLPWEAFALAVPVGLLAASLLMVNNVRDLETDRRAGKLPLAAPVVRVVRNRVDGPSLNGALARTGMLQLVFCVLLSAGLLLS